MADFVLKSLRGGVNTTDPKISLPDDQVTVANNVEFFRSMLGERRRGTDAIDLPASISGKDRVTFVFRYIPSTDETAAELYVLGVTSTTTAVLSRKTTSWSDITISDTPLLTGFTQYQWQAAALHGKLFFAFDSNVDRLHVLDAGTTTMRRTGLAEPAAPTGANDGGVGTFSGTRYYRVRYTVQSSGVTLRRSEPSDVLTFAPNGNDTGITVTKPASISESETHWELEASLDNVNFYRLATTVVGTTTVTDTTALDVGYGAYTLSEDIGDYSLIPSGKFLVIDEDRLVIGGSWEDTALASRVTWTPVLQADGVGNDERLEEDTDPQLDLDGLEGGGITGMAKTALGTIWVLKAKGVYKLIRTGLRKKAYDTVCLTKDVGAIFGSVVPGVDALGRPCVYFFDQAMGFMRAGVGGLMRCGEDIYSSWSTVNLSAAKVVCSGVFYPASKQVHWHLATGSSDTPDLGLCLQTNETRDGDDGVRRGWTTYDGTRAKGLSQGLYSTNIDAGVARNLSLVPFIGTEGLGLVHRCDTGSDDNGTAYAARIVTKPYMLKTLLYTFGVHSAALLAKAVTGATVDVKLIRDFGLETVKTVSGVTFDATGAGETDVIKVLDNFSGSELRVAAFEFVDPATPGTRFELNQLVLIESEQQSN